MAGILSTILFFLPFIAALCFFIVSLVLYISAKKKQKQDPESAAQDPHRLRILRILLILSSVMVGLLILFAAALIIMLYFAIAYM